jgi:hypothetical protein
MNKNISPIIFIDKLVKKNELGQPFKLTDIQREILRLAFAFDENDRLPWDTIIYSCVKKSGKTTINGAVTLAWGFTQEAPNEILVLANDLEQTLARVFNTMEGISSSIPSCSGKLRFRAGPSTRPTAQPSRLSVAIIKALQDQTMGLSPMMRFGATPASQASGYGKS